MSEPNADPTNEPAPAPQPTLTQEQVTAIAAKEKAEGERAAERRIVEAFDGKPIAEVQALLKANQEREDAEKSELEKARSENEKLKSDSESKTTKLQSEHHADRLKLRLLRASVPLPEDKAKAEEALDDLAGFLRVPVGASVDDIDTAIDGLKEKFPQLFSEADTSGGTPGSVPSVKPQKQALGKTGLEAGLDRASQELAKRGIKTSS